MKDVGAPNILHSSMHSTIKLDGDRCIKFLNEEFPKTEQLQYLDNEYEYAYACECDSVRKAIEKTNINNRKAIVFEYIDGADLKTILEKQNNTPEQLLDIAISITNAIADLHSFNIIHNNICPENILIERYTGKAFLIDLSIASRINLKLDDDNNHIIHEACIDYLAPEQTGRINRMVDYRTDLYSLGVILYRMFSGKLPFSSDDSAEVIYAHVAKTPATLKEVTSDVPEMVSHIVAKLLAKNAEERYQSATGLKADLIRCKKHLAEQQSIPLFDIAQNDFSGKLQLHHKLYGKEQVIGELNQLFDSTVRGRKELLFVTGHSGRGKTSLINELSAPAIKANGFLISGKFERLQHDAPYSAFTEAFKELTDNLLTQNEALLSSYKNRISESVGTVGKILTDLVPPMETLIGTQPDLPQLKGKEFQNTFNYVLNSFIRTIATREHPLIIFIDDLQWADAASLNLFAQLAANKDAKYLMLIGAYRDNEITEGHGLNKVLDELKEENVTYHEIDIENLDAAHVYQLLKDALRTSQNNLTELTELIFLKTNGNPLYVYRFIQSIFEEGFLKFNFGNSEWEWDKEQITRMNVSGNVVELMTASVKRFPENVIDLLKTASCIGNSFPLDILTHAFHKTEKEVLQLLQLPLSEGLIIKGSKEYRFAHDRIHQAIYSLIPETERQQTHLKLGDVIHKNTERKHLSDNIFDIVNQWNLCIDIITEPKRREQLSGLNLLAGRKAKYSAAYEQALSYFEKSIELLNSDSWEKDYQDTLAIYVEAAEAAYLSRAMERVDELVNVVLAKSKSQLDTVRAYEISIQKLIAENKYHESLVLGLDVLKKLGVNLPIKPSKLKIIAGLLRAGRLLKNKTQEEIENLPEIKDPDKAATMRILAEVSASAYWAAPDVVPLIVFRMISITLNEGLSKRAPHAFAASGYIFSAFTGKVHEGLRLGDISLSLARQLNARENMAQLAMIYNVFLAHWVKPFADTIPGLEEGFQTGLETGDHENTSYLAHNITYHSLYAGVPLTDLFPKGISLLNKIQPFKRQLTIIRLDSFIQSISDLIKGSEHPGVLEGEYFKESEQEIDDTKENGGYYQNLYQQKLLVALVYNKYKEAYEYAQICKKYHESVKGSLLESTFYFYEAIAYTSYYNEAPVATKKQVLNKIKKNLKRLKKYEHYCTVNFGHKRMLLEAEYYRIKKDKEKARNLYDLALKKAVEHRMPIDQSLIWEKTAEFYLIEHEDMVGGFYVNNAYMTYKRWGAEAKAEQLIEKYKDIDSPFIKLMGEKSEGVQGVNIDLSSIVKASTALSGEIVLSNLLKKLMKILVENAGARRALFIMEKEGTYYIEAEMTDNVGEAITMQSIPLEDYNDVAKTVINYVFQKKETVLLDNAVESPLFSKDEYIRKNDSKSLLCTPIINQGKLQGIIYLSNDITGGAFTQKRVEFLKMITGQIAISIENALLYDSLEQRVQQRTEQLEQEKKKSDDLLLNILPEDVADELKNTGRAQAKKYDTISVMFTDFKDFTNRSENMTPEELVTELDTYFCEFDRIVVKYGLEKIKTIGDAYLCIGGISGESEKSAINTVRAASEIMEFVNSTAEQRKQNGDEYFEMRIGITTGPVVAGIVGEKKFAYDIWGDTVNTAARLEQSGVEGRINISDTTYEIVKDKFECEYRGEVEAKNKGMLKMYFLGKEKK